jgi:hypothetical protein
MSGQTTWRDFESSQDVEEGNINEKLDLFDCKLRIHLTNVAFEIQLKTLKFFMFLQLWFRLSHQDFVF